MPWAKWLFNRHLWGHLCIPSFYHILLQVLRHIAMTFHTMRRQPPISLFIILRLTSCRALCVFYCPSRAIPIECIIFPYNHLKVIEIGALFCTLLSLYLKSLQYCWSHIVTTALWACAEWMLRVITQVHCNWPRQRPGNYRHKKTKEDSLPIHSCRKYIHDSMCYRLSWQIVHKYSLAH